MTRTDRPPYPPDWKERVAAVLARAGNRCECTGECGDQHLSIEVKETPETIRVRNAPRCNAPNGEQIIRRPDKPWIWDRHPECSLCLGGHREAGDDRKPVRVMLTVAHVQEPAESGNHTLENLKAMCQRCHLCLDRDHHVANARATRRAKQGQDLPFEEANEAGKEVVDLDRPGVRHRQG